MSRIPIRKTLLLLFFCLAVTEVIGREPVEQWHPIDITFSGATTKTNPFKQTSLHATFKGPQNMSLTVPGFYAGNNVWTIRFAPTVIGKWTWITTSSDSKLNGQLDSLQCVANTQANVHGRLFVDATNPHHFKYDDGSPYFLLSFEADWLGLMDFSDPALVKEKSLVDMYAAQGFTQVLMNIYAFDTSWKPGKSGSDDFGPTALYPWLGTNAAPNHTQMNPAYFDHYDKVIEYLFQKGIVAHIFLKVYNKMVTWPAKGSSDDSLYFCYVTSRYQAYPNIIWDFAKEAYYEADKDYEKRMIDLMKANDGYHRILTTHDDDAFVGNAQYDTSVDYYTDQNHDNYYTTIINQRKARNWPIENSEFGYEWGPNGMNDFTYNSVQSPESVLKATYEIIMAGGYPNYYYTYHAWDVVRWSEVPKGLKYYGYLSKFILQTRWQNLIPDDALIGNGSGSHCLAKAGTDYIVYLANGGASTLTIAGAVGSLSGFWMNAYTGAELPVGPFGNGAQKITSPWPSTPALLTLTAGGTVGTVGPNVQSRSNDQVQQYQIDGRRERIHSISLIPYLKK